MFLRRLARIILILAILLWGAYGPAHAAQFSNVAASVLGDAARPQTVADTVAGIGTTSSASLAWVPPQPIRAQIILAKTHCRTMSLLGSSCGPDVALGAVARVYGPSAVRRVPPVFDAVALIGAAPLRVLDPPRSS